MAHPSKSLDRFSKTMNRSLDLIEAGSHINADTNIKKELGITPTQISDMLRSGVVLGVSAMDAYFTDRFTEELVPYIKSHGPNGRMVNLLAKAGLDTEQALEMAAMTRPYRRIRTLVQRHLDGYVTQKVSRIDELLAAFRLDDFCKNVEGRVGRTKLLRSIEILVQRRHEIVHNGDLNSHGRLQVIGGVEVVKRLKDIVTFVDESDRFIDEAL